jgi:hypothetical protein
MSLYMQRTVLLPMTLTPSPLEAAALTIHTIIRSVNRNWGRDTIVPSSQAVKATDDNGNECVEIGWID